MKSYAVIGLGNFGRTVAIELARLGSRVFAVDSDPDRARDVQPFVDRAMIGNAADEEELRAMDLGGVDAAVVSLGARAHDATAVTLYLTRLGVPEIVVKAIDEDHGEILSRVGATRVVYPEKEMALRTAKRLSSGNVLDYFAVATDLNVGEFATPKPFVGKTLSELALGREHGILVLAIKELVPERTMLVPEADTVLKDSDILLVAGREKDLGRWGSTEMQRRKFVVIGLGGFGRHTARFLCDMGQDVLAIDKDSSVVEPVRPFCSRVEALDGADQQRLTAVGVSGVAVGVVGLGTRIDASILTTMSLKKLGVRQIVAKAVTEDHAQILAQMGASEVVQPEKDAAIRLAQGLIHPDVIEEIPFLEGYFLTEIVAPRSLWGVLLSQSGLRRRHHLVVVAIKRAGGEGQTAVLATATQTIHEGDTLVMLARPEALRKFREANT